MKNCSQRLHIQLWQKNKTAKKKDNTCICKYPKNHFPLEKILTTQFLKQE